MPPAPAHIYYKFEGNNTSGSHKLNSAIAQAYYAKKQGLKGVTTETGAGQWGTALSMACSYFDLDCQVYMVKQTPMKGHPVFIAQHATATCCRECIRKWHKMQPGRELSQVQQDYLVDVIMTWIQQEIADSNQQPKPDK